MPDAQPDQSLHLPSLVIKNFRGIDELTIPRLGRVTLLAGKNGVGKTTVLDAVRIWAGRGQSFLIDQVLRSRGDSYAVTDNGQQRVVVDKSALFTNRKHSPEIVISLGTGAEPNEQRIRWRTPDRWSSLSTPKPQDTTGDILLEASFGGHLFMSTEDIWESQTIKNPDTAAIVCGTLGPDGPADETLEQYWTEVALTSQEDLALEALNLITASEVERVAALGPPVSTNGKITQPRRMMAKVKGVDYQVPLRSLGDGAMRTYAVALALAKSSGGFLLIDEAENGIHHSVQAKFWEMVLKTAQRNNVQVLATTHSADCAYRFGQVASELEDIEGILYRIQRNGERLRAVPYPEDQLTIAAEHGIEVR